MHTDIFPFLKDKGPTTQPQMRSVMQLHIKNRVIAMLFIVTGLIFAPFAGAAEATQSKIEIMPSPQSGVNISSANSYEQDGKYFITGTIGQRQYETGVIRSHVDIEILGTDGSTLINKQVFTVPKIPHHNPDSANFILVLNDVPPPASTIRLTAHTGNH